MSDSLVTSDADTDKDILDPETLEPRKKPIDDAKEAHAVAKRLFDDRQTANEQLGLIRLKYDGEPPYKTEELTREGRWWSANFSVKSISVSVSRSTPPYISLVDGLRFLTAARLPDAAARSQANDDKVQAMALPTAQSVQSDAPDAAGFPGPEPTPLPGPSEKSEIFQRGITSLVRGWPGFRTFLYRVVDENTLYGFVCVGWPDDIEWRPEAFTFDRYAISSEASHDIGECEAIAFRKDFAIHELVNFIQDRKAAEDAGWDVDNVVDAVNDATPEDEDNDKYASQSKRYADTIRNATYSKAMREKTKVVRAWIVVYREYDGSVSQYIVARGSEGSTGDKLFYSEERFDRMADVATLFSVQWGNGKHYGSIGMGRELYGPHIARDRNMCRMQDGVFLNSMARLPEDRGRSPNRSPLTIQPPFLYVDATAENLAIDAHPFNLEAFSVNEEKLSALIQTLSNAYLPKVETDGGEKATAREIIEDARRVDMLTGDKLARFYGQLAAMMETIQRRACSPENIKAAKAFLDKEKKGKALLDADEYKFLRDIGDDGESGDYDKYELPSHLDKDSVMLCVDFLRQGLTPLDIFRLSRAPASEPLGDTPAILSQKIGVLFQTLMANPGIDQARLLRMYVSATGSPQIAEELCLKPDQANADGIKQAQQQLLELGAMQTLGIKIPVSSDDNHPVHRQVLKTLFSQGPQTPEEMAANPVAHNITTVSLAHYNDHLAAGKAKGEKGPAFEHDSNFGEHVGSIVGKADQIVARQSAMAQQQPQLPAQSPS